MQNIFELRCRLHSILVENRFKFDDTSKEKVEDKVNQNFSPFQGICAKINQLTT